MFLLREVGEGGGAGIEMGGRKVNEKRRFVVCAPMVVPTHGPPQRDAQTCADSDAIVPQPAAEDSAALTRVPHTFRLPRLIHSSF